MHHSFSNFSLQIWWNVSQEDAQRFVRRERPGRSEEIWASLPSHSWQGRDLDDGKEVGGQGAEGLRVGNPELRAVVGHDLC